MLELTAVFFSHSAQIRENTLGISFEPKLGERTTFTFDEVRGNEGHKNATSKGSSEVSISLLLHLQFKVIVVLWCFVWWFFFQFLTSAAQKNKPRKTSVLFPLLLTTFEPNRRKKKEIRSNKHVEEAGSNGGAVILQLSGSFAVFFFLGLFVPFFSLVLCQQDEVKFEIMSLLDDSWSLVAIGSVCRSWNAAMKKYDVLWKKLVFR
jgi:hypothetical protein